MLIVTDINDLGDKRLSPEEGVAKLREGNAKLSAEKHIPNQKLLEDHEAAAGTFMLHSELIRRIKKLNPKIVVEDGGVPGAVAVRYYCWDEHAGDDGTGEMRLKYITGFYKQPLQEFSSVVCDEHGIAAREVRGWRSVLLALMQCGAHTYEQQHREFGDPQGSRSILWREQTAQQRV
jgi:hypothetical protein